MVVFLVTLSFFVIVILSGGNNWAFWRYALPCYPLLVFLMGNFFKSWNSCIQGFDKYFKLIGYISFFFLLILIPFRGSYEVISSQSQNTDGNRIFYSIAKFEGALCKRILNQNQSLALSPVPMFAYTYKGWVYDMLGLTDAKIAHRKVKMGVRIHSHEKGDGYYILAMRPTIILFMVGFLDNPQIEYPDIKKYYYLSDLEVLSQPEFKRLYQPYNIFIPHPKKYFWFCKLKDVDLKRLDSDELDEMYKNMLDEQKDGFSIVTYKKALAVTQDLSIEPVLNVYNSVSRIFSL